MSDLKFVHKLLDGIEVTWMPLGDVVEFKRGEQLKPIDIIPGVYPIVTASKTEVGSHSKWNFGSISVTVTSHGAYAGHVNYWSTPIWLANNVFLLLPIIKLNQKFLYFFLKSNELKIQGLAKGGGVPYFNTRDLAPLLIPIPCPDNPQKSLEIQAEIVRILDAFTCLTAELTAELTARKQQYNYYRDRLLSFPHGEVEWKTLGDIGDVKMCKRILKSETQPEGDVPFYKIGTFGKKADAYISRVIFEEYKRKYSFPKKGDVLISAAGTIGRAVIYDGEPAYFQDSNIVWLENDESVVTNKYLWHFYKIANWAVSEGGTIDRLYNDNIKKTKIIIPYPSDPEKSLAEQNRVVAILDKFYALTHSLTEGLPREIELRQKQYEYYRDLLLSFPYPEVTEK